MSPPANAAAVAKVLAEIDADPGAIANRSQQDTFLKILTSRYKLRYHSNTFGHTCHDEKSLRSVLVAIMRHHGKYCEDIRPGKTAVDELFERGSEMLQDNYVEAVKDAAKNFELEEDSDSEGSEEEVGLDQELLDSIEAQTDSDDEYMPTRGRQTRSANRKRQLPLTTSSSNKKTDIDAWILGCSIESAGKESQPSEDATSSTSPTSSDVSSSIVVIKGRKRKASVLTDFTLAESSGLIRDGKPTSAVLRSETVGEQPADARDRFTVPASKRPRHQNRQGLNGQASHFGQDPMLSVKLLAVAAIAALL